MKVMDNTAEEDCTIETPVKKKKMKQARLSFQMLNTFENPNNMSNKKRKRASPSVDTEKVKVIKLSETDSSIEEINVNDVDEKIDKDLECVVLLEDITTKDHHNDTKVSESEQMESNECTPKRLLIKRKKTKRKSNQKLKDLTKFPIRTDEETESDMNLTNKVNLINDGKLVHKEDTSKERILAESNNIPLNIKENAKDEMPVVDFESKSNTFNSDSDLEILSSENEEDYQELDRSRSDDNDMLKQSQASTSTNNIDNMKQKKLTPKQLEKKLQIAKRQEEKQKLRLEKEKERKRDRETRRKEKEEKRKEKEEMDKIQKELKRKEKEQKELKRQVEIELKQKEKEMKDEERRKKEEAKEEEKRKREEERLEAERKKQKAASNFVSFFVPKKLEVKSSEDDVTIVVQNFMPFEIKADMRIAPISRRTLNEQEKMSLRTQCNMGNTVKSCLYLEEMRKKIVLSRSSKKTWPLDGKGVIILDKENCNASNVLDQDYTVSKIQRPKLLQFAENRRPPYWGTWRKSSGYIKSRKPFSKDLKLFDYEVDSDEEWEEEEPGESLKGSDDEKDEENPEDNDYDIDNEFMVPHGYLSDEEARADEEETEDMSPETQKFKLKLLGEEFEEERNTKTSRLQPKIIGCIWQGPGNTYPDSVPAKVVEYLKEREAWVKQIPIALYNSLDYGTVEGEGSRTLQSSGSARKSKFPTEGLPDLIRLVHGNTHGRSFIVKEFMTFWSNHCKGEQRQLSKASVLHQIREVAKWIACPEEGPLYLKTCWYVTEDVRKQYLPETEILSLPNCWDYTLTHKRKVDTPDVTEKTEKDGKEKEKRNVPLITQFTKKLTPMEMKQQLAAKSSQDTTPKSVQQKHQKRATLVSVRIGEEFPDSSRKRLLSNFLRTEKNQSQESPHRTDKTDEVICITDTTRNIAHNTDETPRNNQDISVQNILLADKMDVDDLGCAILDRNVAENVQKKDVGVEESADIDNVQCTISGSRIPSSADGKTVESKTESKIQNVQSPDGL